MINKVGQSELYTLEKLTAPDNPSVSGIKLVSPPIKGIVFSGGGARGIAYPGMLKALEEKNQLSVLTHVSGASAGAMTASFFAIGMNWEEIKTVTSKVNLSDLLDTQGKTRIRARGKRFRNFFEVIYYLKIRTYLEEEKKKLEKMPPEEKKKYSIQKNNLKDFNLLCFKSSIYAHILDEDKLGPLNSLDDFMTLCASSSKMKLLDKAFASFPMQPQDQEGSLLETSRFTFSDFEKVRNLLPKHEAHKIKYLSVVTTNLTMHKLQEHCAMNSPNVSVAEMVQLSGAHPFIFSPVKNKNNEYIADGAFIDNMPAQSLINLGLTEHEILCIALTSSDTFNERLANSKKTSIDFLSTVEKRFDSYFKKIVGTEINQRLAYAYNQEKLYYHIGNLLYLDVGNIGVADLLNSPGQKLSAFDSAYHGTKSFIDKRNKTFDDALLALMYLESKVYSDVIKKHSADEAFIAEIDIAADLKKQQVKLVDALNQGAKDEDINSIIVMMKSKLEGKTPRVSALCFKQVNYSSEGKLEAYTLRKIEENTYPEKKSLFITVLELIKESLQWLLSPIITYFYPDFFKVEPLSEDENELIKKKKCQFDFFQSVEHYMSGTKPVSKEDESAPSYS